MVNTRTSSAELEGAFSRCFRKTTLFLAGLSNWLIVSEDPTFLTSSFSPPWRCEKSEYFEKKCKIWKIRKFWKIQILKILKNSKNSKNLKNLNFLKISEFLKILKILKISKILKLSKILKILKFSENLENFWKSLNPWKSRKSMISTLPDQGYQGFRPSRIRQNPCITLTNH